MSASESEPARSYFTKLELDRIVKVVEGSYGKPGIKEELVSYIDNVAKELRLEMNEMEQRRDAQHKENSERLGKIEKTMQQIKNWMASLGLTAVVLQTLAKFGVLHFGH